MSESGVAALKFGADGLLPAIVRDATSREVLMLAYMNEESLRLTRESGETWFWSRSRQELWNKGATSGNRQRVVAIASDCDRDALLIDVEVAGPACHTGKVSCFGNESPMARHPEGALFATGGSQPLRSFAPTQPPPALRMTGGTLASLEGVLIRRKRDLPEGSYSAYLFKAGRNKILKKIGEEATEVVIAATNEGGERLVSEVADLLYHVTALLVNEGIAYSDVEAELARRAAPNEERA